MYLIEKLKEYSKSDMCPMHMPGHKRNSQICSELPLEIDVTEVEGFDNLHGCEEILLELSERCAKLYGCDRAFPLINGSTCGILSAISACVKYGDDIIIARNCHKSVYHAIMINGLNATYIMPNQDQEFGINASVSAKQVENALKDKPNAKLVVVTSPTYEGVVSDIEGIAQVCHQCGVLLMVDQAHGAHFGFSNYFPKNAIACNADLVIMSLHKTMPAMTQTALLCVNGQSVPHKALERQLAIFQTSSPSYVLLASIENCVRTVYQNGKQMFENYTQMLANASTEFEKLRNLSVLCHGLDKISQHNNIYGFDFGKLVVSTRKTSLTGTALADLLRDKYHIETEMASSDYIIAMTSICDSLENFKRFVNAILQIDQSLKFEPTDEKTTILKMPVPQCKMRAREALEMESTANYQELENALGHISTEYVWAYPPGIPLIVPGEIISNEFVSYVTTLHKNGVRIHSDSGNMPQKIGII